MWLFRIVTETYIIYTTFSVISFVFENELAKKGMAKNGVGVDKECAPPMLSCYFFMHQ
jgi:hypothetical protein